jgi:hypothetical protein
MVARVVAENIASMTDEHMEAMPWTVRPRIWRLLQESGLCLHAWKLFTRNTPPGDEDVKTGHYRHQTCEVYDGELQIYTRPLDAPATQFISHLTLTGGCEASTSELLCLADMKNLGILEIIQPGSEMGDFPAFRPKGFLARPHVSDRLVRGWAEIEDPFPALRLLRVWCIQPSTTEASFQWVSKFPRLVVYDVMGQKEDWRKGMECALEMGWNRDKSQLPADFVKTYVMLFELKEAMERLRESPEISLRTLEDLFFVRGRSVVPSKPIASLTMGCKGFPEIVSMMLSASHTSGSTTRNTFTRFSAIRGRTRPSHPASEEKEKDVKPAPGTRAEAGYQKGVVRSRKRKRLDDVLRSMAG